MHELILGGQRSGKSRCAEQRAAAWLAEPSHSALLLATAQPGDDDMRLRIERHRFDRAQQLPRLATIEEPRHLALALRRHGGERRLIVIDCLTLWLTNLLMPLDGPALSEEAWLAANAELCEALRYAPGPVVLVSNEIGLGVSPMSREARRFVDELGRLHQSVAAICETVTLMVAGIEMTVKARRA